MLFQTPSLAPPLEEKLDELERLRKALGHEALTRSRWMGSLRRQVRASSAESSTSIEGFSVSPEEALALTSGRLAAEPGNEDRQAVACYSRALDHVGTMAVDPSFRWLDRVILDLHFDVCYFQRDKDPGLWRPGPIGVTGADGSLEYRGPDAEDVVGLMDEVVGWLDEGDREVNVFVRAAMAHLNVISVHPFRDGNGRIARIVQSLVLARGGLASPDLFSIAEYLGSHTQDTSPPSAETQGGGLPAAARCVGWISYCLDAHSLKHVVAYRQVEQAASAGRTGGDRRDSRLARSRRNRTRAKPARGHRPGSYCEEAEVSPATASADFRRLLDAGLVTQRGRTENITYLASKANCDRWSTPAR